MVPDEDRRACRIEVIVGIFDREGYAGGELHDELEEPPRGPLRAAVLPEQAEEDRDEDAIAGGEDEAGVGGEEESVETGFGDGAGEHDE